MIWPWRKRRSDSGDVSLRPAIDDQVAALPADVARRITLRGRLGPPALAEVGHAAGWSS